MINIYKECDFQEKFILFLLEKLNINETKEDSYSVRTFVCNRIIIHLYYWEKRKVFYAVDNYGSKYNKPEICYLLAKKLGYERL